MGGTSCAGAPDTGAVELSPDTVVTYQLLDSAVPPRYHRSVELRVSSTESRIIVDSYGDVLADETVQTDPRVWAELGSTFGEVAGLGAEPVEEGCTGGTVTSLMVVDADSVLADLQLEECGSGNAAQAESVQAWIAPAREQFPAMDQLAPEGP